MRKAKGICSFVFAVFMLFNLGSVAEASNSAIAPCASLYLDGYSVCIYPSGGGRMAVGMTVDAVGIVDEVGVLEVFIEEKVGGKWYFYESLDCVDHPEFSEYDTYQFIHTTEFEGRPGYTYRVSITPFAIRGSGSDTGYLTSPPVVCK